MGNRSALSMPSAVRAAAQFEIGEYGSVIGEADQARVEGRIPQCGEKQPVVNIEALCVVAFGPRDDDEPLGLGRLRQAGGARTKPRERGVG